MRIELSYVLPLKWTDDRDLTELGHYLREVSSVAEVIVVDGSEQELFEKHAAEWGSGVVHMRPDPRYRSLNGKVDGVTTGIHAATHEAVVIADDDVRYEPWGLRRIKDLLTDHDVVRPQNYFDPVVWHAAWDSARSLLNRAFSADFPGTLGVRRSTFLAMGGYDGDVLFENLELIRTVHAAGGSEIAPLDLYVRRLPPNAAHFLSQRVRQAYDDFALPGRMALWLSLLPALGAAVVKRSWVWPLAGTAASIVLAETGRRRSGGARYIPARASFMAPLWLAERAVCAWVAVAHRVLRGGVAYRGGVIARAATPPRQLAGRASGIGPPTHRMP